MIKFSISLSIQGQVTNARQQITVYLAKYGINQTGDGLTTLSFIAKRENFDKIFLSSVRELSDPLPRPPDTVGASGPLQEPLITAPEELKHLIDNISIVRPARHFYDKGLT